MNSDEEKLFLDQFYALHRDQVLLLIFEKYGIAAFRRSCVLRNFDRFLKKVNFTGERCVEIGTCNGMTAIVLSRYFKEVVSIDNAPNSVKHEILEFTGIKNVKFIDCMNNEHKKQIIDGLKFDAAFSDANHHEDTQFDFDLVKRCGNVLFDEYWKDQRPVWRLVNELTISGDVVHDWKFASWKLRRTDQFIERYKAKEDGDLMQCDGVAYQRDMSNRIVYNEPYFDHYVKLEGLPIAVELNAGRAALVNKYLAGKQVLDVGVGSGEFIKTRPHTKGFDINHRAIRWLRKNGYFSDEFEKFEGFTFWDVIEHVHDPNEYFKRIKKDAYLFTSIPIFENLRDVRSSRHFKPGEHLYYFTKQGFIDWMALYGFELLETSDFETKAGRQDIMSFAFKRSRQYKLVRDV